MPMEQTDMECSIPESGAPFNEVEEVIYRRRSVRVYKKKQVPEYLIQRLLETARFAPSAGNGQTWKFIVIQDPEMIKEMEYPALAKQDQEISDAASNVLKITPLPIFVG